MALLLGIDIGTSSVKALLFDPEISQTVAVAGQEYPILNPQPDRAEQNPDDWWAATVAVIHRALAEAGRDDVAAISLSGQMHGTVLLGADDRPIQPAIIWADRCSGPSARALIEQIGAAEYAAIAGTLPAAGFMISTLHWLKEHEPAVLSQTARAILPKDYVRLCLTGEVATEVTDAISTAALDVTRRVWSEMLIERAGLPMHVFPRVLQAYDVAGRVTASAAAETGLAAGIPVVAGCGDQPAQAIGSGLLAPGLVSVTTGSGGQVFTPLKPEPGKPVPTDPRLHVFIHAVPDMDYVMGAILSAGLSLRWLRNLVGLEGNPDAYPILSAEASQVPPGAGGLIFLPYLYGERTPHMDAQARGCFVGLSYHHGRGHLARAVMEGVSFALRQSLEMSLALGGQADTVIAAGGGAESDVWRQIQADVFGRPLKKSLLTEQASIGAAVLAGVGVGAYASFEEAREKVVRYGPPTDPDMERHARYDALYARYLQLYPDLREHMHGLAAPA